MKKHLLILSFIFASVISFAQPKHTFWDNWHIGIHAGPTIFLGDVSQKFEWYKTDFSNPKLAFGIYLNKEINCWLTVRGQLGYGWLGGEKDFYYGGAPAGLRFKAHFYHFNAQAKVNFIDLFKGKCYRRVNIYGFAGLGFINFQNRLYKNDQEILSWGYGRIGTHKWVTEITVPFGLGMDVRMGQNWRVNLDVEYVWVDNEKLDRVVGMYEHDAFIYPTVGITYRISKNNRVCCQKETKITPEIREVVRPDKGKELEKANRKLDSLYNLLTKSNAKLDDLTKQLTDANAEIEMLQNIKDTVFIAEEGTQYPDSVNRAMDEAGYIWYNVYFDLDKYNVKPIYENIISNVAGIMKRNADLVIIVVGNADQQGNTVHNEWLSKQRALAVMDVLIKKHGIDPKRLILEYKGDREPISNVHFEVNRRVDFIRKK